MKKFLLKNKVWVLGFLYLVGIFIFVVYFFVPNVEKLKNQSNDIQKRILDKKILENRLSQLPEMGEKSQLFYENEENLGKNIKESEEVAFIKYLEELAKETNNEIGINIPERQFSDNKNKKSVQAMTEEGGDILGNLQYNNFLNIEIELSGNFPQTFNFIKGLENSEYYNSIVALDMQKLEKENSQVRTGSIFSSSGNSSDDKILEYLKTKINLIIYKNGSEN